MDFFRRLFLPGDARSTRGTFARGKPVYKGGVPHPKAGPNIRKPTVSLQEAARRRLVKK